MPPANVLDRREEHVEPEQSPGHSRMLRELGRLERRGGPIAQLPGEVVMAALDEPPEGGVLTSRGGNTQLACSGSRPFTGIPIVASSRCRTAVFSPLLTSEKPSTWV